MNFKQIITTITIITITAIAALGQCLEGNCVEGQGVLVDKDNNVWLGEFADEKLVGTGVCHFSWGAKYVGAFEKGNFEGEGTYYHTDGSIEEGIWKNGVLIESTAKKETKKTFKTKAIIIGIDNYDNQKLSFAVNDAQTIQQKLEGRTGQNLETTILLNEEATVAEVNAQLDLVVKNASKDEVLLFFFFGTYKGETIQLIDGDLDIITLKENLSNSAAHQISCFLDATHQQKEVYLAMKNAKRAKNITVTTDNLDLFLLKKEYESSIEFDGFRYGIFAHYLMRCLNGIADKNMDGNITNKELFDYTSKGLYDYSDGRLFLELLQKDITTERNLPIFSHTISK
ncbi:MAG: caspase family protein [Saprospiraceae bacterium]